MEILLVIDMQQKYMDSYESDLLERVNMRIQEAVAADIPVVYVRNVGKIENEDKYVLAEGLDVVSEYVFAKRWPSAFSSEEFAQFIERLKVDTINMVGVDGRCCVARSAMDARKRGYAVRLYLDSVAAINDNFYLKELPEMQETGVETIAD
ncbi:isochorismatase family protein [Pseudobutyrivibrio xylanivorans]|uniref:Nicotinamidase-related amidase n=1 Tax=Pseudobutyrivibrio xylanivorans DSM 14809 TaxID=1123012 RepID=A0A1M6BLV9_PSEXY|nr:isochorismatase family protein [Pseudobutyrivibrio xylanivorans]SHI49711.1 Nicotinamidase-related amidase [Pseudobutyrivibrio xylanivorans DSM 14809]